MYRKAQPRLAESKAGQESRDSAWYGSAILWSVTPTTTVPIYHRPLTRAQSIALVLGCTILGAAAQMLMKIGLSHVNQPGLMGYITSVPLLTMIVPLLTKEALPPPKSPVKRPVPEAIVSTV